MDYGKILDVLDSSNKEDLKKFQSENPDCHSFTKEQLLEKFLQFKKSDLNLQKVGYILNLSAFGIGVGIAIWILSKGKVHINLFLLFSIILPFFFTLYSGYEIFKVLRSRPPVYHNKLADFLKHFAGSHGDVINFYILLTLQLSAIFYMMGFLVGSFFVFLFKRVTFYYESTFNITPEIEQKLLDFFSNFYHFLYPKAPNATHLQGNEIAIFVLALGLIFVVLPRFLLYLLFRFRLRGLLKYFVYHHPNFKELQNICTQTRVVSKSTNQEFREKMGELEGERKKGEVSSPSSTPALSASVETSSPNHSPKPKGVPTPPPPPSEIHFLFYQSSRTDGVDLSQCVGEEIEVPIFKWAFNYFGQSEEELEHILRSLKSYVVLVVNANKDIIPNEEFREYLEQLLTNHRITRIYIILCQENRVANRFSYVNYEIWQKFCDSFDKVELYEKGMSL
jgi:hypothetical protein